MIIVKIFGGLGNQMFQYALFKKLITLGVHAKMDISYYETTHSHNGYELSRIFHIEEIYAKHEECTKLAFYKNSKFHRLLVRLIRRRTFYSFLYTKEIGYDPNVLNIKHCYLEGYWQSERYFADIKDIIISEFNFNIEHDNLFDDYLKRISETNAVSIHIRRGDYLSQNRTLLCDTNYYENAIETIRQQTSDPHFYIFSNDIPWCKEHFQIPNVSFVNCNHGVNSYRDMYLMSQCKHNIIADSSFSWWGAWLNQNPNKIVIAPENWIEDHMRYSNTIPDSWISIPKH